MPNVSLFKTKEEYNEWFRKYRAKNANKLREYHRIYYSAWRKKNGYHNEKNYIKRHPEKHKARRLFRYAIEIGLIKRLPCEKCGNIKSHGHHTDYTKPLDVIWLCPLHHSEQHKMLST